jgi:NAD(P)-dependent dehydrogenase (short-subunit alcohol dehydrogenase family)
VVERGQIVRGKEGNVTKWTLADIPSMHGRPAVITGANSGIGWHTALELARAGSEVILTNRTEAKGRNAVDRIRRQLSAGGGADGGAGPGEFGTYGDRNRRLATRPPALPDGAFVGTSLLLVAVFNCRVLSLSPLHHLQGETHA